MEMTFITEDYTFFLASSAKQNINVGSAAKERLDGAECMLSMQPEGGRLKSFAYRLRFHSDHSVCVGEM
jgi:hypothetical protein